MTQIPDVDTHHREIWSDAKSGHCAERPPIYYVENHNAPVGYAEAALDFEMLVSELLPRLAPHEIGNWSGPVLHLARQTVELRLKALLETVCERDKAVDERLLGKHDLATLWSTGRGWLLRNGYALDQDARLKATDELVLAFHAVDPSGDLFRFAQSRQSRFGKKKSYDRVGVNHQIFPVSFKQTVELLHHWEAVLFREQLKTEYGWDKDPYFDAGDFPKLSQPDASEGAA